MSKPQMYFVPVIFVTTMLLCSCKQSVKSYTNWAVYGGSKENLHYSSLTQIDTSNVSQLKEIWSYHTGDADTINHSEMECNPVIIEDKLYGISAELKVFSLDAETGKENWVFNPADSSQNKYSSDFAINNSRGIAYWKKGTDERILHAAGGRLYCINATNGKLVSSFGERGSIDLHDGLDRQAKDLFITTTSPGIVFKDLLILGGRVSEGDHAAPGHIRAFDIKTGKLVWIFHTIPFPGEFGYDNWPDTTAYKQFGGANCWAGFSLDEARGIVYAPLGSASPDDYGGKRLGSNLFANCLVALNASTGKRIWHYQTIHHDVWDRDLPAAPALVTIHREGKLIDAVAQVTKTGFVYLFNRETGEPLFNVVETAAPGSDLKGEKLWPTQPIPDLPKPFVRQSFSESQINKLLPDSSYADIKKRLNKALTGNLFYPPSLSGTIFFPGYDGGAEWGGPSYDPESGWLYVNAHEMPWLVTATEKVDPESTDQNYLQAGKILYQANCANCHGQNRIVSGSYPSLLNGINKKYDEQQFSHLVRSGRRMMPAFKQLTPEEISALATFILDIKSKKTRMFTASKEVKQAHDNNMPYSFSSDKFLSKEGYPAIEPPWGTLTAIDLNSGQTKWKVPLGEYEELKKKGIPPTGTENYGGSAVTAGGIIFIAASRDGKLRAFNKRSGKIIWETALPAPGFATPSVYSVKGRQFVVIACGGGKLGTNSGDTYAAFALQ